MKVFAHIYQILKTKGYLEPFEVLGKQLLVSLDGTEYFSSQSIHCEQCSHRTHKNGTVTYFHSAILQISHSKSERSVEYGFRAITVRVDTLLLKHPIVMVLPNKPSLGLLYK